MNVITQEKKRLLQSLTYLNEDIPKLQKKYPEIKIKKLAISLKLLSSWAVDVAFKDQEKRKFGSNPESNRVLDELKNINESLVLLVNTNKLCKFFSEPNHCNKIKDSCDVFNKEECAMNQKEEENEEIEKRMRDSVKTFLPIRGFKKKDAEKNTHP